jgi:hypothetical protein
MYYHITPKLHCTTFHIHHMNRLIIIGNGFDLAHGLKTRYSDFMLDYLKDALIKANSGDIFDRNYTDKLIRLYKNDYYNTTISDYNLALIKDQKTITDFLEIIGDNNYSYQSISDFMEILINHNREFNWVDIENLFHKELLRVLNDYHSDFKREDAIVKLKKLNEEMAFLKEKLVAYLTKIESKFKWDNISSESIIMRNIFKIESAHKGVKHSSKKIIDTRILNFNYTKTVNLYCKELEDLYSIGEIPLHGQLADLESIVFGFGDEVHKSYQEIEDLDENLFFEHIKSFKYFQNQHYQDLMAFLESGQFEVFVLGHSLGLSDRTMLQAIFNSDNLEKVQLFYYEKDGKNNFVEMTHQLSRHFTDKNRMRIKVVSFDKSEPLPQFPTPQENP